MRVLVVDDNDDFRHLVASLVRGLGFDILVATDGDEALVQFLEHGNRISLIVTDINMTRMSGLDLIKEIRAVDSARVKIIAISAGATGQSGDVLDLAVKFGADAVFGKPFDTSKFREAVRSLIGV